MIYNSGVLRGAEKDHVSGLSEMSTEIPLPSLVNFHTDGESYACNNIQPSLHPSGVHEP